MVSHLLKRFSMYTVSAVFQTCRPHPPPLRGANKPKVQNNEWFNELISWCVRFINKMKFVEFAALSLNETFGFIQNQSEITFQCWEKTKVLIPYELDLLIAQKAEQTQQLYAKVSQASLMASLITADCWQFYQHHRSAITITNITI